ncbi:MAG: MGMT family protein [Lachnospiraceae bacterium]|nr:MGMT family protein [Lachnospiraceae bacterium]
MTSREEALAYALSFPNTYQDAPFHDMNWQLVRVDGSIPPKDIERMIADSYDIVTDTPTKRIYEAVKKIPKGKVATYGQVAALAGNPRMSRAVGNALHKNPEPGVIPCHRVVDSKGKLADEFAFGGVGIQKQLLEDEGVEVVDNHVNLKIYQMK